MNTTPTPPINDRQRLSRALIIGAIFAIIGIVLFVVIYAGFNNLPSLQRLLLAMCIPPGVIAVLAGIYILVSRPRSS